MVVVVQLQTCLRRSVLSICDHAEWMGQIERLSSLAVEHGEVPSFRMGKPVDLFDHLLAKTKGGETLPTWRGELYLEFHRGVSNFSSEV